MRSTAADPRRSTARGYAADDGAANGRRPLRVCYFGTYRAGYSRNQIMIAALQLAGVEVLECHVPLWRNVGHRVQAASGGWLRPGFLLLVARTYCRLIERYRHLPRYDIMVLGYPGQLDVFLARLLTWLRRKPLVLDVFMSIYLVASERGLTERHRTTSRVIYWVEKIACLLPDRLILDTSAYVEWFADTYGISRERFRLVPTGADDRVFRPTDCSHIEDGLLRVVYYGSFIPNHGVEYIVEAAKILASDETIQFELIGQGPDRHKAATLARGYGLSNVSFVDWVDREKLSERVADADVCLAAFGTTPQSLMTIQNKIYEGLAMAKPIITGDSETVRQALQHCKHVYLCARADPVSLAKAIDTLRHSPEKRQRLAKCGHELYRREFSLQRNGSRFAAHLRELGS
jgi:glycosyltransferase involved in cell wall biosynthesis